MEAKNTKTASNNEKQSTPECQRTLESILDEYKIISLQLFKYSDQLQETDKQREVVATKQAQMLDAQQELLIEAQSIKIETGKDVLTLLELWKADEVYSNDVSPGQGIVLHLQKHFEKESGYQL